MKKAGLIGGMGPESTIPYYHDIVYGVHKRCGSFPELTIESVNVFRVLQLCSEQKYDEMTEYLMKAINNLASCGADFAALTANTPHIVFDRLKERSPIPLISIIEATLEDSKKRGYNRLALFGTIFTMTGDFYKKPFTDNGIEIIIPTGSEMQFINEKISTELELGIKRSDTLASLQKITARMKTENKAEAVILGCTELPLILDDSVSLLPCLDTMKIHIDAIVNAITEE